MYQDLSTRHDWLVENTIVEWPIRWKGDSKRISGNSLSPLGAQTTRIEAPLRRLYLPGARLRLRRRLRIHHRYDNVRRLEQETSQVSTAGITAKLSSS